MFKVAEEVRRFAARHALTGPGVVAVSGGADSVALLRSLHAVGLGPLIVVHLNHKLRGDESDTDERFVTELATRLGLMWRTQSVSVADIADQERSNIEAVARRLRYDWFVDVAHDIGASWIATGHTADDQAETVLHRFLRGTGLQGLRGIAAVRGVHDPRSGVSGRCRVVRPLLAVTRAEILAYLATLDQPHREDATNADIHLTRNRLRHELLPLLRTYNPAIVDVLGRLAHQADETFTLHEMQAASYLGACEYPRAGEMVILDAAQAKVVPDVVLRDVVRLVWRREGWPANSMTFDHWERAVRVIHGDPPAADFPGGVHIRHTGRVVQLRRQP